eukprot:scaffold76126_cov49-Prasinocladus_malaysianus.AAC.1
MQRTPIELLPTYHQVPLQTPYGSVMAAWTAYWPRYAPPSLNRLPLAMATSSIAIRGHGAESLIHLPSKTEGTWLGRQATYHCLTVQSVDRKRLGVGVALTVPLWPSSPGELLFKQSGEKEAAREAAVSFSEACKVKSEDVAIYGQMPNVIHALRRMMGLRNSRREKVPYCADALDRTRLQLRLASRYVLGGTCDYIYGSFLIEVESKKLLLSR